MKAESNTYRILCILSIVALVLLSGCFDNGPLSEYQDEHIKVTTYKENDELLIEVQAHSGEYSNIVIVAKPELSGDVKDNVDGEPVVEIHKSSQGFLGAINNVDPVVELYDKAWTVALKDPKVDGYIAWDDSEEIATFSSVKNALDDLYPNPSESMKPLKGFAIMIDSAATKIMNGLGSGTRTVPLGPGDKVIFRYTLLPGYNLKSNDEYKIDYEAINTNNLLDIDVTLTDPHGIESPTQKKLGEYFKNDMLPKSGQWAVEMENCIGEITISNVTIQEKNCHNDYDLTTTQIYYAIWMQKDKEDGSENTFFAKDLEPPLTTLIAESFTHGSAEGSLKKTGIGQSAVSGSSLAVAGIKLSSVAGGASMEAAAEIPLDKIIESDISDSEELWFKARLLDTDEVFISMSSDSAEDDLDLIVYDLEGNVLKSSNVPAGYREEGFIITSSDQIYIKVEKFSASNGKFYLVVMGEPVYTEPVIPVSGTQFKLGLDFKNPSDTPVLDITTRVTLPGGLSLAEGESAEKSIIKIFGWSSGKLEWSMTGEKGTHKVLIEIEGKAIGKDLTTSMRYPVVILPNSDYNSGGDAPDGKEGALLINNNPDYVEGYFVLDNDSRDWYKALVDDVKEIQIIGGSTMGTYLKVYHEDTPLGGCDLYRGCDLKDSIVSEQGYVYVEVIRGPGTVSEYQFILELKGVQDACMANEGETRCGYPRQNGTIVLSENIYYPDAVLRFGCNDTAWQWKENVEVCVNDTVCIDTPLEGPHCEKPQFFGSPPGDEPPAWTRPRPDDRYDISKPTYYWTGNFSPETIPEVGVLFRGHMLSTSKLLARFNEPVVFLDVNFNPDPLKYPILVVPSGGLYGLESSPSFRKKLDEYVRKGGTIFTFSQQYGYEYSALPGELSGFGWEEDQSCLQAGTAISEYHPILAGQDSEVSDVQVDGYFTKWPENATIPLTRTKNGMPALVIYEHGNGTVIASTIFTDWNYDHGQVTEDGINLVRDIIAWVKYPEEIPEFGVGVEVNLSVNVFNYHLPFPRLNYPEYNRGDSIRIPVNVTNYGNITADRVKFSLLDSEYVLSSENVSVSIAPNETKVVNFTYQSNASSKEGVYFAVYSLYAGGRKVGSGTVGSFSIGVNTSKLSQYKVIFTLRDPDKDVITEENVSVSVEPGGRSIANFTYPNSSKLGIWYLEYEIVDFNDTEIESGVRRFAVSKFGESAGGFTYQESNITFGVNSDREHYAGG